jgi:hypothetical protein
VLTILVSYQLEIQSQTGQCDKQRKAIVTAYTVLILIVGLTLAALAWVWLLARAFNQHLAWGILSLVMPPAALFFALRHAQRAIGPLILFVLGSTVATAPGAYSLLMLSNLTLREHLSHVPEFLSGARTALESDIVHEWMEGKAYYMQIGGVALAAVAWIWLLVRAFRQNRKWGIGSLVFAPVGLIFADRYPRRGAIPLGIFLGCLLVAATPAIYTLTVAADTSARSRVVGGEEHLTLTGSDPKTAPDLKSKQDVAVLQMANSDVNDQSLEALKGMKLLRELDLSGSQVTDAGLEILKELPALATLRLARTKITDNGFRSALFAKESLMQLDLRSTSVSRETIEAWRAAKPGRHFLQ